EEKVFDQFEIEKHRAENLALFDQWRKQTPDARARARKLRIDRTTLCKYEKRGLLPRRHLWRIRHEVDKKLLPPEAKFSERAMIETIKLVQRKIYCQGSEWGNSLTVEEYYWVDQMFTDQEWSRAHCAKVIEKSELERCFKALQDRVSERLGSQAFQVPT